MIRPKIDVFSKTKLEVEADCKVWAEEIGKEYRPDIIVFLAKSGFLFAKSMAEYFCCPMVDITVSRPGNDGKDVIKRLVPKLPQWLLFALLRSKASYGYQESNKNREVKLSERFKNLDWKQYKKILIVDDSTDTGWSLLAVKDEIEKRAAEAEIRTASYCVIDLSKSRVNVEYSRYRNTIVVSATSRYSKEYKEFMNELTVWQNGGGIAHEVELIPFPIQLNTAYCCHNHLRIAA